MALPPDLKITTDILWAGTLLFAILDAVLVPILAWWIKPAVFRRFKWELVAVTGLFWGCLWFWVTRIFWEPVYSYVFPAWSRGWVPIFQAGLAALVAGAAWRVSIAFRPHPILPFFLFTGLWGMLTHLWAVQLGIVEKPPVLQGASAAAAVIIAVFEYPFYWCMIVAAAGLVHNSQRWLRSRGEAFGL